MRKILMCVMMFALFLAAAAGYSEDKPVQFDISAGISQLSGDVTYKINGFDPSIWSWQSELEFELETYVAQIQAEMTLWSKVTAGIDYEFSLIDADEGDSTLKDTDWFTTEFLQAPYLYSMSDLDSCVRSFDVYAKYYFNDINEYDRMTHTPRLFAKGGYKKQHTEFTGSDTSYDYTTESGYIPGKAIDYEADFDIPYIGFGLLWQLSSRFDILTGFDYSAWAVSEDTDNHLLRSKIGEGSTDNADYYSFYARADWWALDFMSIYLNFEYTDFKADGHQDQYFYAGEYTGTTFENVNYDIDSEQTYFGGGVKFRF